MHIHGEEASDLLCSLAGMLKIHLSDSGIKVHVPDPLVYNGVNSMSKRFKGSGCTAQSLESEKGARSLV